MLTRYLYVFLTFVVLISCNSTDNSINFDESAEITSFEFDKDLNADFLSESVSGTIKDHIIKVMIPDVLDVTSLIASFEFLGHSVYVTDIEQKSGVTENDFSKPVTYKVKAVDGTTSSYELQVVLLPDVASKVPHLYIQTDDNVPIDSKEDYVAANLQIDGKGVYDDFDGRTRIRGRGNDSWTLPKKPYKLKLDSKAPLFGLLSAKEWILRSNYRAESLMLDAVAFRMASLLGMPYTHHAVPVDVTVNGEYMGSYMFTEQKEAKANRINVVDGGMYLNLDTYMHKPPGLFYSDNFELPVMVRYPSFKNLSPGEVTQQLNEAKADFHTMENIVADASFPDNNYLDYFEAEDFVNYMIVYNLSLNREINHPKSTYMHKHQGGKYKMGPVWDFDWGFGYHAGTNTHFNNPDGTLFVEGDYVGNTFFSRFMEDPVLQTLYKKRWEDFKINDYPQLLEYILDYATTISESYQLDYAVWGQGVGSSEEAAQQLIQWLDQRVDYMDQYVAEF